MIVGRFPFAPLSKYPHMKPEDVAVWNRFVAANSGLFDTVDYDVPVGTGADVDPEHPDAIQYDAKILTRKKVDVVAYKGNAVFVIEVKPVANARGLGQILTYLPLWLADHPGELDVRGMVVAGEMEREMAAVYAGHQIIVHIA